MNLLSKFAGSLLGTEAGDCLGAKGEGFFSFWEPSGISKRYTDDTHMMIGVAESLIENRGFNPEHMMQTFIKNYEKEPWRGYGPGPPRIFALVKKGEDVRKAAEKIYRGGSFGNGSAMRVAPVGCFYYDNLLLLREVAFASSRLTHSHPLGMEGAAIQAFAIALAVKTAPSLNREDFIEELENFTKNSVYREKIKNIRLLLTRNAPKEDVVRILGNGIEAFNSVPTAIYSFLRSSSFKEAVVYAVSLGGDTDTIGAMTGAIAGAFWGIEGIPAEWVKNIENADYIKELARKLWETKTGKGKKLLS